MPTGIDTTSRIERETKQSKESERGQIVAEREQTGGIALRTLLEGVELRSQLPQKEVRIRQVTNDSRKVESGSLFVAVHGVATDGNLFAKAAADRGAVAVLSEDPAAASRMNASRVPGLSARRTARPCGPPSLSRYAGKPAIRPGHR